MSEIKFKSISINLQIDLDFAILVEKHHFLLLHSQILKYCLGKEKGQNPKSTQPLGLRPLKVCGIYGCLASLQKINFSNISLCVLSQHSSPAAQSILL